MGSILSGGPLLPPGIGLFLVQVSLVLTVTRLLGGILKKMKQPVVVAEVLTGILLGPSALGAIPGYLDTIFPCSSLTAFALVAKLGLVFYLFLVGLEVDPGQLASTGRTALSIALSGIAVPFALAIVVAWLFRYLILENDPSYDPGRYPFGTLVVFTGVGMSISAFAVLARILAESRLIGVPVGSLALSAAALNDALGWCLLALAVAMVQSGPPVTALYILLLLVAYGFFLAIAVRPFLSWAVSLAASSHKRSWRNALLAAVFICIFLSGWLVSMIGLDPVFGAFLVGIILPREKSIIAVVEKIEDVITVVFLPLYFTLSGLKTDIFTIHKLSSVLVLFIVMAVGCGGKILGCSVAARLNGIPPRESLAVGVLMNTRGLMEVIVLNLGLQAGVINVEVFTILVLMAMTTTLMTSPLIRLVYPQRVWMAAMEGAAAGKRQEEDVLLDVSLAKTVELTMLVPADTSKSSITGLYLLLPGAHRRTNLSLVAMVVTDSTSTATMMGERLGTVSDDAREMMLFGSLVGARVEPKYVVAPTSNAAPRLSRLMRACNIDLALLPWKTCGKYGTVDYEQSLLSALPMIDGRTTCVLFRDNGLSPVRFVPTPSRYTVVLLLIPFNHTQGGLADTDVHAHAQMPTQHRTPSPSASITASSTSSQSTPTSPVTTALEDAEESAVLDLAERMLSRGSDVVELSVVIHGGMRSRQTTTDRLSVMLQGHAPPFKTKTEQDLCVFMSSRQVDVVLYAHRLPSVDRHHHHAQHRKHAPSLLESALHAGGSLGLGGGGGGADSTGVRQRNAVSDAPFVELRAELLRNTDVERGGHAGGVSSSSSSAPQEGDEPRIDARLLVERVQAQLPNAVSLMEVHKGRNTRLCIPSGGGHVQIGSIALEALDGPSAGRRPCSTDAARSRGSSSSSQAAYATDDSESRRRRTASPGTSYGTISRPSNPQVVRHSRSGTSG